MKRLSYILMLLSAFFCAPQARGWYDSTFQRWIQRDPIGEMGGINLYQFVGNNPINFVDPFGLSWWVSTTPFPGQIPNMPGPYTQYVNDGYNWVAMAPGYPFDDTQGVRPADAELFMMVAPLADPIGEALDAAAGLLGTVAKDALDALGLGKPKLPKPAIKCPTKAAPSTPKPAWSKPLTPEQAQKLQDAMAKSPEEKFKTGGFNAAMYQIMIEQGATPQEAYLATFGRFNKQ